MQVLNVHGAVNVAGACHQNVSLTESIAGSYRSRSGLCLCCCLWIFTEIARPGVRLSPEAAGTLRESRTQPPSKSTEYACSKRSDI